jgi:glutaconate CoA-transferase subunit B
MPVTDPAAHTDAPTAPTAAAAKAEFGAETGAERESGRAPSRKDASAGGTGAGFGVEPGTGRGVEPGTGREAGHSPSREHGSDAGTGATWTDFSWMVIQLARCIREDEVTFSGVNSSLAMLACLLAQRACPFRFTYINVAGGVDPHPARAPVSSSDPALFEGSPAIFANADFYDLCLRGGMDLCFLGCAQVDATGRTNVSLIGPREAPRVRLPGGGGAVVMLPTARRVVTWRTEHSTRSLVERLDFVTAAGRMATLVTPLAVFHRDPDDPASRFALAHRRPGTSLEALRARTGFAFAADTVLEPPPPSDAEREALAALDPEGRFAADLMR